MRAEAERMFYQQRAKGVYLKNSDRCTRFFHDLVKRNNKRNVIVTITKQFGEQTISLGKVAAEFVGTFPPFVGHGGAV